MDYHPNRWWNNKTQKGKIQKKKTLFYWKRILIIQFQERV
jgi:hypothetical protein